LTAEVSERRIFKTLKSIRGDSMMNLRSRWRFLLVVCVSVLSCSLLLVGCSSGGNTEKGTPTAPSAPEQKTAPKTPFVPVDACSLLTQSEAGALTGKTVLPPKKEEAANLVTCTFGDPTAAKLPDGTVVSYILKLSLLTGEEGAYADGPVNQAKDAFEIGLKNAATPQKVAGLGDDAYWDDTLHTLNVHKGRYELEVEPASGIGMNAAKGIAEKALAKLP
jgi:hypothetical protein